MLTSFVSGFSNPGKTFISKKNTIDWKPATEIMETTAMVSIEKIQLNEKYAFFYIRLNDEHPTNSSY